MKDTLIYIGILGLCYLIAIPFSKGKDKRFEFMSFEHSNIYRGIAALLVISQHVTNTYGVRYLTPLGGVGVAIFLISSGYGLNESYKKKRETGGYWPKKLVRVLLPYLMIIAAMWVISTLLENEFVCPQYWYIRFVFFWYIIFYLLIAIPGVYKWRYLILGIAAIYVLVQGNYLQSEQAVSFLMGVLISDVGNKEIAKRIKSFRLMPLLFAGLFLLVAKQIPAIRALDGTLIWYIIQMIMKINLALFVIAFVYKFQLFARHKLLAVIGDISYEFYLVHIQLLFLLEVRIAGLLIFLVITVIGAFLINKVAKIITRMLERGK